MSKNVLAEVHFVQKQNQVNFYYAEHLRYVNFFPNPGTSVTPPTDEQDVTHTNIFHPQENTSLKDIQAFQQNNLPQQAFYLQPV